MPQGNKTGPEGAGPMTGRSMGYCTDHETAGFESGLGDRNGRGLGRRVGRQRGMRGGSGPGRRGPGFRRGGGFGRPYRDEGTETPLTQEFILKEEVDFLSNRLEALKRELEARTKTPDSPAEGE